MTPTNRQIVLDRLPQGKLTADCFRLSEAPVATPGEGEALLRARYVALDAANRAWMLGATYRAGLSAGEVMDGLGLAEVVESRIPGLAPGDLVTTQTGWQDYAVRPAEALTRVQAVDPLTHLLNVYGVAGLTAYFGLLDVGQPKPGETVVVSAAAGAVGSLAGQIAKLRGCRVVGIAGGPEKCAWLTGELGFDAAVDYKPHAGSMFGFYQALQQACGGGIDVYFDNVGGETLDACLFAMNNFGRVAACGAVSLYDAAGLPYGVRGMAGIVSKRVTVRGFIVSDFYKDGARERAVEQLQAWVASGDLKVFEDILEGLESLPPALVGLLAGENRGKRIVHVA